MGQRKAWSPQEDKILKQLYQNRKITKWAEIARVMQNEFGISGRSGKQCRERYHNHLDTSIKHQKWSKQEQLQLITVHQNIGNRWAQISRTLNGRSQNCVKNKFYSILRKGLKVINLAIKTNLKRYKQLSIDIVYKIVQSCQACYKRKTMTKQLSQNVQIKKKIINFALLEQNVQINEVKQLIQKIKKFEKNNCIVKKQKEKQKLPRLKIEIQQQIQSSQQRDQCPIYEIQPKFTSLQGLFTDNVQNQQQKNEYQFEKISYPKFIKNTSVLSNMSYMSEFERQPYDLVHLNSTIKSFEFGQLQPIKQNRLIVGLDNANFEPLRSSFNSFTHLYPH